MSEVLPGQMPFKRFCYANMWNFPLLLLLVLPGPIFCFHFALTHEKASTHFIHEIYLLYMKKSKHFLFFFFNSAFLSKLSIQLFKNYSYVLHNTMQKSLIRGKDKSVMHCFLFAVAFSLLALLGLWQDWKTSVKAIQVIVLFVLLWCLENWDYFVLNTL